MTLICELNQYVIHIYEGLAAMPCSGGIFKELAWKSRFLGFSG